MTEKALNWEHSNKQLSSFIIYLLFIVKRFTSKKKLLFSQVIEMVNAFVINESFCHLFTWSLTILSVPCKKNVFHIDLERLRRQVEPFILDLSV